MRRSLAILAVATAAAALAGCGTLAPTAVDTRSAAASRVLAESGTDRPYPTFADIPATPRDVRTVAQYDEVVREQQAQAGTLAAWRNDNPAINIDTDAFAAEQQRRLAEAAVGAGLPPVDQGARSAAYAAEARARAAPPPPPR